MIFGGQVQKQQQYRKLQEELLATEAQVDEKRQLLRSIASDEFLNQLANQCAEELATRNSGAKWLRLVGSGGSTSSNSNSTTTVSIIHNVLRQNLSTIMGDVALTEDEINAKQLLQLTAVPGEQVPSSDDFIQKHAQEQLTSNSNDNKETLWAPGTSNGSKSNKKSVFVI